MGLLEYLKKIFGDEEGQKAFDKIQADKENRLLVDPIKEPKYVEKSEVATLEGSLKELKKTLKDRDTQLEGLKTKAAGNETMTAEIERLKGENAKVAQEYEAKLTQLNFDTKFEKALSSYNTKNPKAVKALLDMEKVKLDGETFLGLDDQMKALEKSDAYLFGEKSPAGTGTIGATGATTATGTEDKSTSIGEMLGKQQADQAKINETINSFFK